jgi:hypothetical protein
MALPNLEILDQLQNPGQEMGHKCYLNLLKTFVELRYEQ